MESSKLYTFVYIGQYFLDCISVSKKNDSNDLLLPFPKQQFGSTQNTKRSNRLLRWDENDHMKSKVYQTMPGEVKKAFSFSSTIGTLLLCLVKAKSDKNTMQLSVYQL